MAFAKSSYRISKPIPLSRNQGASWELVRDQKGVQMTSLSLGHSLFFNKGKWKLLFVSTSYVPSTVLLLLILLSPFYR